MEVWWGGLRDRSAAEERDGLSGTGRNDEGSGGAVECRELCLGVGHEPAESSRDRIGEEVGMGGIAAGVSCGLPNQEDKWMRPSPDSQR